MCDAVGVWTIVASTDIPSMYSNHDDPSDADFKIAAIEIYDAGRRLKVTDADGSVICDRLFTKVDNIHSSEVSSNRTRTNYGVIIEKVRNDVTLWTRPLSDETAVFDVYWKKVFYAENEEGVQNKEYYSPIHEYRHELLKGCIKTECMQ